MGIEPTLAAWEAAVLPLNYTRVGSKSMPRRRGRQIPIGRAAGAKKKPGLAARFPVAANPGIGSREGRRASGQNPPPTWANTVVLLPPSWLKVTLAPRLASRPNSLVRAPNRKVP